MFGQLTRGAMALPAVRPLALATSAVSMRTPGLIANAHSKASGDDKVKRKKKDPNAPKRASSAYMFFVKANRDEVLSENPGITFGETGRALGKKWNNLSSAEKAPYEEKANEDKIRYQEAKAAYDASKA
ncbi:Nhp6bp [Sugiyamaella lignohabitans]|uniref:Nhp6bp n=1 Tax=Sugiyamaella lignohabitans TaxID=796027 RepID=A0A167EXH5_9ASCO|nr:Nhp6bp [Sugiyamaella lignohabitans]ANB14574.1 Nhp6bp [Sugiyamaella lignohabitans]